MYVYVHVCTIKHQAQLYLDMSLEVVVSRKTMNQLQHKLTELLHRMSK